MSTSYTDTITTANTLLNDNKLKESIPFYEKALKTTDTIEEKIDLLNLIGRLYLSIGQNNNAIKSFENSLKEHEKLSAEKSELLMANKGGILNNLGILAVNTNVKSAIDWHKKALGIFTQKNEEDSEKFKAHLANTHFSLADAFYKKPDFYQAKKQFKNAILFYKELSEIDPGTYNPLIASTHYYLGNIYNDDNAVYDAKMHFRNSLTLYRNLTEENPAVFRPFLGAVANNLGVVCKAMLNYKDALTYYLEALANYKILADENRDEYLPFLAATYNSLGIVYVDLEKREEAINNYTKSIETYHQLADEHPENYTHYLATALHNIATLYDEKSEFSKALDFYNQALNIRKMLAVKEPQAFNADVCVTSLNIITLYQALMEKEVAMKYRSLALDLLKDVKERLATIPSDKPVFESMKSDVGYFNDYFNQINLQQLETSDVIRRMDKLNNEVNSTVVPSEKEALQAGVISLIENTFLKYPGSERLQLELADAFVTMSWFMLRQGKMDIAREYIIKGIDSGANQLTGKSNLAHIELLSGNFEKAKAIYLDIKDRKSGDNQAWSVVLSEDFDTLKRDGNQVEIIKKMAKELK